MTQSNKLIKSSKTSKFRESRPKRTSSKSLRSQWLTLAHLTISSRRIKPANVVTTSTKTLMTSLLSKHRKDVRPEIADREIGGIGRELSTKRSSRLRKASLTNTTRRSTSAKRTR
jgi:hypothetical protein